MAVDNQKLLIVLLERLVRVEAASIAALELQAIQGEATNVQLNALTRASAESMVFLAEIIAAAGGRNIEIPEVPRFEAISLTAKYDEFYDAHYKRIEKEVVRAISTDEEFEKDLRFSDLIH